MLGAMERTGTARAPTVPWQEDLASAARRLGAAVGAGFAAGALVGGIGGRLAMLVLRLTSNDGLHGLESDDGFVMGQVTGASLFLVGFCAMLGVLGALLYVAVRAWLPAPWRPALTAIFGGVVGGALFVHADGIDFRLLEPRGLAVALFVALPAAYGFAMGSLVERLVPRAASSTARGWFLGLLPLLVLGFAGEIGLLLGLAIGVLWAVHRSAPGAGAAAWTSPSVRWTGRALLLALMVWSLATLARDVTRIL
jgi:hypothetical protein